MTLWPWKGYNWTLTELSAAYGIQYNVLYGRLKTMTLEAALRDLKWDGKFPKRINWQTCAICRRIYKGQNQLKIHHKNMHKGVTV